VDRFRSGLHPVFGPWHAFEGLPPAESAAKAPELAARFAANADDRLNPRIARLFAGEPPASMEEIARRYGGLLVEVFEKWRAAVKAAADRKEPAPTALPDAAEEALRQVLYAPDSPASVPKLRISEVEYYFDEKTRNELNELQAKVDQWHIQSAAAPPQALILEDLPIQHDPRVFVRGNPSTKGEVVPRQFLAVLSGPQRKPFHKGSGRLELAEAITRPDNPLTARVMVNRVWAYRFGRGLVDTPSDFGLRSEPPSHPELLDYLAFLFSSPAAPRGLDRETEGQRDRGTEERRLENGLGWSLKRLHRLMLLSASYQQSSAPASGAQRSTLNAQRLDPQNRLLSRMNRRRLDFEALRDSLLYTSGQLDPAMGGPSLDLFRQPFTGRRSVYGLIDRQNLPGLLRVFDFANPDRHSPQRHVTTSPQQALFMLNSPFVTAQVRSLLERPEIAGAGPAAVRVRRLYRLVYGRDARPGDLAAALDFLAGAEADRPPPSPWRYGWGEVDESGSRVASFRAFPHFTGEAWQGGPAWPDPATGWARLTAVGGHAGNDAAHAVIRRWTAPLDGVVAVSGKVSHGTKEGDGVRARIFSSRLGRLGEWTAHNGAADTRLERVEVRKGETLDFVVDCRTSVSHDDFQWSPVLVAVETGSESSPSWDAARDFAGPPLTAWEQYAQALLSANEFVFVD
jgi:hypothetical protein